MDIPFLVYEYIGAIKANTDILKSEIFFVGLIVMVNIILSIFILLKEK